MRAGGCARAREPVHKILIVDDEAHQRELLEGAISKEGYSVRAASSGEEAVELVRAEGFDLAMVDLKMSGMDGITTLKGIKEVDPDISVIIMTAYGTVETAVEAMKEGAFDYLTKPLNLAEVKLILKREVDRRAILAENRFLREELKEKFSLGEVVADSGGMKEVLSTVARVAKSDATVLIRGESGTGKEIVARAVHSASPRSQANFIPVSCAALPETLLEAELFGCEKGAFTGADRRRLGRFELANAGTIFLDEIGDIPPSTQVKLLRVLQERQFERLGGTEPISVDVRIIAATNQDLEAKIKERSFREDLYYRLNVVSLEIPPLRERREDILPLVEHFLKKYSGLTGKKMAGISRESRDALLRYSWPGNIRELENWVERAVVLARQEVITTSDLPLQGLETEEPNDKSLEAVERRHIERTLKETGGNLTKTAQILRIHRNTLRQKIKKLGISKP